MILETINVYEKTGLHRPEGANATLTSYVPETPQLGGVSRRWRPAVLILPGGAYEYCSDREAEPVALKFAACGWAAFVLRYTCAPHPFPVALREAAASMAYIRENAAAYGIDPHMAAAVGFSAGGHLCGTLGTMYDAPEVADVASPEKIRPDTLGLCYPVTLSAAPTHEASIRNISGGDPALASRLGIDRLIRPDMCPVFLWHTRDDGAVPSVGTLKVGVALEEAGVPFALHMYDHGQHGLSTSDELVFPSFAVPETSWDVAGWHTSMMRFFGEHGLRIHDDEVAE